MSIPERGVGNQSVAASKSSTENATRIAPVVSSMCKRVDAVFVRYVGPIAPVLSTDTFNAWTKIGKLTPSGVTQYIHMLSRNIDNNSLRLAFFRDASSAIRKSLHTP